MSRNNGRALRVSAAAIGAITLATVFGGVADASPLGGGLGGDDSGNGYSSGSGDYQGGYSYDGGRYGDGDYTDGNGYHSVFGDHGKMPGVHNGLVGFDVPDVESN